MRPAAPPSGLWDWIVTFTPSRGLWSFDVLAVASTEELAIETAKEFLGGDENGKKLYAAHFANCIITAARGKISTGDIGKAEYRGESKAKKSTMGHRARRPARSDRG